jgi:hypothetical protein
LILGNFIFLAAKGRGVEKFSLSLGTDNIILVLLDSSGLEADSTMKNRTTLASILGTSTETRFTNYTRKVWTSSDITITSNTGTGVVTVAAQASPVWNAAGGAANATLGAILFCHRPTSGSADSAVMPICKHDFAGSTTGVNLTASVTTIFTAT